MNNDPYQNNDQKEASDNSAFSNTETADEQYNPYDFSENAENRPQPCQGMAITSMILAIVSLVCCGGPAPAVVALILSSIAKKRGNTSGFATAGKVVGIISSVIWGIILIFYVVLFAAMLAELA